MNQPPLLKEKTPSPSRPKDSVKDYTDCDGAPERVMFLNLGFFKYGTNDKAHGAAIVLALILLVMIAIVYTVDHIWPGTTGISEQLLSWSGSAFMFVAGVAVGKNGSSDDKKQ